MIEKKSIIYHNFMASFSSCSTEVFSFHPSCKMVTALCFTPKEQHEGRKKQATDYPPVELAPKQFSTFFLHLWVKKQHFCVDSFVMISFNLVQNFNIIALLSKHNSFSF